MIIKEAEAKEICNRFMERHSNEYTYLPRISHSNYFNPILVQHKSNKEIHVYDNYSSFLENSLSQIDTDLQTNNGWNPGFYLSSMEVEKLGFKRHLPLIGKSREEIVRSARELSK